MSSVSGVNAAQTSLIDQLKAQQTQPSQRRGEQFGDVLQSLGVDSAKVPALEKQIRDAAEAARQGAGAGQDQHAAVKQAVEKVLSDNGVDPAKFDAAVKARAGKGRKHHGHRGNAQGVPPPSTPAQNVSATPSAQVDVEG